MRDDLRDRLHGAIPAAPAPIAALRIDDPDAACRSGDSSAMTALAVPPRNGPVHDPGRVFVRVRLAADRSVLDARVRLLFYNWRYLIVAPKIAAYFFQNALRSLRQFVPSVSGELFTRIARSKVLGKPLVDELHEVDVKFSERRELMLVERRMRSKFARQIRNFPIQFAHDFRQRRSIIARIRAVYPSASTKKFISQGIHIIEYRLKNSAR
jgi:hypothetical protein